MIRAFSWQNSINLCHASFCIPRANVPVTPGISWLSAFATQSSRVKRASFGGISSRMSCRSSQNHSTITGQGKDMNYCDIEWFALETSRDHSVIFEIASKYCISDSFVDYDGYSISSKGFLSTVVDIMII